LSIGVDAILVHEPRILREKIFEECKIPGIDDARISYLFGVDGYLCRKEERHMSCGSSMVIRDRDTTISQYPYHHGFGTPDQMIFLMAYLLNQIHGLDLVFYVDVDFDVAFKRIMDRANNKGAEQKAVVDYFEKEEKLRKIHLSYRDLFSDPAKLELMGLGNVKIVKIDGNKNVNEVKHNIIDEFLNLVKINKIHSDISLKEAK
jgi:thymidylate kinase